MQGFNDWHRRIIMLIKLKWQFRVQYITPCIFGVWRRVLDSEKIQILSRLRQVIYFRFSFSSITIERSFGKETKESTFNRVLLRLYLAGWEDTIENWCSCFLHLMFFLFPYVTAYSLNATRANTILRFFLSGERASPCWQYSNILVLIHNRLIMTTNSDDSINSPSNDDPSHEISHHQDKSSSKPLKPLLRCVVCEDIAFGK